MAFVRFFAAVLCAAVFATSLVNGASAQDGAADTVYTNGKIYTVNEKQPWAEAVAIKDGKFLKVGSNADIQAVTGKDTKIIDLGGKFGMPGIHDTHVHPPLVYGHEEAGRLLFPESKTADEIIEVVKAYAAKHPDLKIIRGEKWSTGLFPGGKATKAWLDPHFPDRAVYLIDETGHNGVVNSKLLEMASITKDTPDPEFGVIDRDPKTGEPTGYLSETAMSLIGVLVGQPDEDAWHRSIVRSLDQIRAYGTTSLIDMATGDDIVAAYRRLEKEGKLNMRVDACVALNDYQAEFTTPERSEAVLAKHNELDTPLIDINLKYWADGSPFSKTALLIEAYSDDPTTHGEMTIGPAQFERIIKAHKDGMQVRLHSTGDGTTRRLLDLIEKARAADPKSSLRHHIGHLMVVHPDDIPRFKELNVIAEFSPVMWHPTTLGATAKQFVGEKRYSRWMAIKEFIDAGATVTFGSDWPAGTPDADPWRGLEAMITRMDTNTNAGEKLGEGIDLKTAIKVFTINGAKAMMHEDVAGSIEAGKHADMIVLDRNLFEIEPSDISDVKVLKTIFAGKVVYSAK